MKIKKQNYFFKFLKATKYQNCKYIKKENIHNRLYHESKRREKLINELEQKIYQNEEEICTFSPKINNNEINFNISFLEKKFMNKNESLYNDLINNYSLSNINFNGNNFNKKKSFINKTNSIKVLNNFRNTNSFFYGCGKSKTNENEKVNKNINYRNNFKAFRILNNYNTNKDIIPINYNKLFDNNHMKEDKKNHLVLNLINKDINYNNIKILNDKNLLNKRNNIVYNTANNIIKRNLSHNGENIRKDINIFNKINDIEIENNNKENEYAKFNNFMKLKKKKNIINKTISINNINKYELKKDNSSYNDKKYFNINTNISSNLLKKYKSNRVINEIDNKNKNLSHSNINKDGMDYLKYKYNTYISKKNSEKNIKRKSKIYTDSDIKYNYITDKKYIDSSKNKRKRINSLQKNNSNISNYINPICLYNANKNREGSNNNLIAKKKDKPLDFININNRNKSCFLRNDYSNKKVTIINVSKAYSINDIEDNFINNKRNKDPFKSEYFYTFRNKKVPYNSFNYFSSINSMINTSKNNIKIKTNNISNNNNYSKVNNRKNDKAISLIEKPNKITKINKMYSLNNKINSIYLSNYDKKNCIINVNKINNNSKLNRIYGYTKSRPSIITNNTNNDTRGCSASTLSAKDIQLFKTNSKRELKNNNSIHKRKDITIDKENKNVINKTYTGKFSHDYKNKKNKNKNNNNKIVKKKESELKNKSIGNKDLNKLSNAKNENNKKNKLKNEENEKSMTLQSLSDSKMLELAEHYVNSSNDCLEDIGFKKIVFKKNKNEI